MRIVLFGDSITDMCRNREYTNSSDILGYGSGYPIFIASGLARKNPNGYEVLNRGISGNRIVDLYARVKEDVWNLQPDLLSILVGTNDVGLDLWSSKNGVDIVRYEKMYRNLIEDTKERLPNVKIILCEPFVLYGVASENTAENPNRYQQFRDGIYQCGRVVEKLAQEYDLYYLPLQKGFDECAEKYGDAPFLYDGIHPMIAGATLIADGWLKLFNEKIAGN